MVRTILRSPQCGINPKPCDNTEVNCEGCGYHHMHSDGGMERERWRGSPVSTTWGRLH
ncbi:hypothetical protein KC19_8G075100 [Ceratodon purpureus]|uniref:Uncharacterized protein n=1 Tax=Ceratodon purpureus TaxID=3225 RepID=A0A8T0H4G1_CERPU|nr:hypothetical protein KC19_N017500 [Ceratodon purpureus]KAG0564002.1 hypothetical protein KC19_8G075100 [Ceratodon purpureus]